MGNDITVSTELIKFPLLQTRPRTTCFYLGTDCRPTRLKILAGTCRVGSLLFWPWGDWARLSPQHQEREVTQAATHRPVRGTTQKDPVFPSITMDGSYLGHLGHASRAPANYPGLSESCRWPHRSRAPSQCAAAFLPRPRLAQEQLQGLACVRDGCGWGGHRYWGAARRPWPLGKAWSSRLQPRQSLPLGFPLGPWRSAGVQELAGVRGMCLSWVNLALSLLHNQLKLREATFYHQAIDGQKNGNTRTHSSVSPVLLSPRPPNCLCLPGQETVTSREGKRCSLSPLPHGEHPVH